MAAEPVVEFHEGSQDDSPVIRFSGDILPLPQCTERRHGFPGRRSASRVELQTYRWLQPGLGSWAVAGGREDVSWE
eukprot:4596213-Pyramimonas_sp.AAC.1